MRHDSTCDDPWSLKYRIAIDKKFSTTFEKKNLYWKWATFN